MNTFSDNTLDLIKESLARREAARLTDEACPNSRAIRRLDEDQLHNGYRQAFSIDADRILHSLAYTRYIDKTQVFYLLKNDHITHRVLHVQLVSKIARTIGHFLGLNEDLIEAIALGHDIGHAPFGHDGEHFLSELCREHDIGFFQHNVQSVQFMERVERKGKGWNLCLQTLDGILCHDGEIHEKKLHPETNKSFKTLDNELDSKKSDPAISLIPMTLEGCVVRMADTISYIGRDIEDAIRMNLIQRSDLPSGSVKILGDTNGTIVFNLVTDILQNSFEKPYVAFSLEVSQALKALKQFNLERIYRNPRIKKHTRSIQKLFNYLFEKFLDDIETENQNSVIYERFLDGMSESYIENQKQAEIVRDFVSGMTDQYFLSQCPADMRPKIQRI
jgi:dGTPase